MPITNSSVVSVPNLSRAFEPTDRLPARSMSDPLVDAYDRDLGPQHREALNGLTPRFWPYAVSRRNLTDRIFTFAEGTAFGFRIEEKRYEAKDSYVQSCPIRKAVAENMRAQGGGRKVAYVESAGMTEIGGGFMGSMRLVGIPFFGLGLNYGFTASTLMRYRTSCPILLGFGERPESHFKNLGLRIPVTVEDALQMEPGSEVELTGQGRVNANVAMPFSGGLKIEGICTAGAGLVVNSTTAAGNETSLNNLSIG